MTIVYAANEIYIQLIDGRLDLMQNKADSCETQTISLTLDQAPEVARRITQAVKLASKPEA